MPPAPATDIGAAPLGAALGGVLASAADLRTTFAVAVAVQLSALVACHRPITDTALRGEPVS